MDMHGFTYVIYIYIYICVGISINRRQQCLYSDGPTIRIHTHTQTPKHCKPIGGTSTDTPRSHSLHPTPPPDHRIPENEACPERRPRRYPLRKFLGARAVWALNRCAFPPPPPTRQVHLQAPALKHCKPIGGTSTDTPLD